jgi:hypothetical protein
MNSSSNSLSAPIAVTITLSACQWNGCGQRRWALWAAAARITAVATATDLTLRILLEWADHILGFAPGTNDP